MPTHSVTEAMLRVRRFGADAQGYHDCYGNQESLHRTNPQAQEFSKPLRGPQAAARFALTQSTSQTGKAWALPDICPSSGHPATTWPNELSQIYGALCSIGRRSCLEARRLSTSPPAHPVAPPRPAKRVSYLLPGRCRNRRSDSDLAGKDAFSDKGLRSTANRALFAGPLTVHLGPTAGGLPTGRCFPEGVSAVARSIGPSLQRNTECSDEFLANAFFSQSPRCGLPHGSPGQRGLATL